MHNLDYFPPNGTKYPWHPKRLNTSPWVCLFWACWPAEVQAYVDRKEDGQFIWWVTVCAFDFSRQTYEGTASGALAACQEAEKCAEEQKGLLFQPWMEQALAAGWRPPGDN